MTMTRTDYRRVADALNTALRDAPSTGGTTKTGVLKAAIALAEALESASGWSIEGDRRFDKARFMEAVTDDGPKRRP